MSHNFASKITFPLNSFIFFLFFFVKDLSMGASLVKGQSKGNVYEWSSSIKPICTTPQVLVTIKVSIQEWHCRLGHHSLNYASPYFSTNFTLFFFQNSNQL